jgi:type III pantothenate kinase
MGTATTLCVIKKNRDYLGGSILPGMRLSMEALKSNTAKLMEVDIIPPANHIGRTTRESIQSGLFYGQLGALKELISGCKQNELDNEDAVVIGTGGFSHLFKDQGIFDHLVPELVLQGLRQAHEYSLREADVIH